METVLSKQKAIFFQPEYSPALFTHPITNETPKESPNRNVRVTEHCGHT